MIEKDRGEALAAELAGESALTLGRAGRMLQTALDALAAHDAAGRPHDGDRAELVDAAGEQAWSFVVLRGALGWHDDDEALTAYAVPNEVRARMGVRRRVVAAPAHATPERKKDGGPPYR